MAQKVLVQLVDDLDGTASESIETVSFGLDGVQYEIDLAPENSANLRDSVASYVQSARRVSGRVKRGAGKPTSTPSAPAVDREQTRAIREWARQQGHDLADRGRIPGHVIQAFDEAHSAKNTGTAKKERGNGRRKSPKPSFSG